MPEVHAASTLIRTGRPSIFTPDARKRTRIPTSPPAFWGTVGPIPICHLVLGIADYEWRGGWVASVI